MVKYISYYKKLQDDAKRRVAESVAERSDLVTFPPKQRDAIETINTLCDDMDSVEITVTFKPNLINASDITLKKLTKGLILQCISNKPNVTAILIHEYGKNGRFHYHGILSRCTKKQLSTIRKQFEHYIGRIEIKTITYWNSYLQYMTKEISDEDHDEELNIIIQK